MVAKVSELRTNPAPPTPAPPRGILIVEDEPAVLQLLHLALAHFGFSVWAAASGREALEIYQRHAPAIDLVLLDVQMPQLDGPQTLKALRALNPAVACCFMSGSIGKYSAEELQQLRVGAILPKPFDLAAVAATLRQLASSIPAE